MLPIAPGIKTKRQYSYLSLSEKRSYAVGQEVARSLPANIEGVRQRPDSCEVLENAKPSWGIALTTALRFVRFSGLLRRLVKDNAIF